MKFHSLNSKQWDEFIFGQADLGDPRRTKKLTQLANDMTANPESSIVSLAIVQLKLKQLIVLFETKVSALNQSQSLVLKEHAN